LEDLADDDVRVRPAPVLGDDRGHAFGFGFRIGHGVHSGSAPQERTAARMTIRGNGSLGATSRKVRSQLAPSRPQPPSLAPPAPEPAWLARRVTPAMVWPR